MKHFYIKTLKMSIENLIVYKLTYFEATEYISIGHFACFFCKKLDLNLNFYYTNIVAFNFIYTRRSAMKLKKLCAVLCSIACALGAMGSIGFLEQADASQVSKIRWNNDLDLTPLQVGILKFQNVARNLVASDRLNDNIVIKQLMAGGKQKISCEAWEAVKTKHELTIVEIGRNASGSLNSASKDLDALDAAYGDFARLATTVFHAVLGKDESPLGERDIIKIENVRFLRISTSDAKKSSGFIATGTRKDELKAQIMQREQALVTGLTPTGQSELTEIQNINILKEDLDTSKSGVCPFMLLPIIAAVSGLRIVQIIRMEQSGGKIIHHAEIFNSNKLDVNRVWQEEDRTIYVYTNCWDANAVYSILIPLELEKLEAGNCMEEKAALAAVCGKRRP